jgi:hypothetical protein
MGKKPYAVGGLVLLSGYLWEVLQRDERLVTRELMRFHRKEEMEKLKIILKTIFFRHRPDNQAMDN